MSKPSPRDVADVYDLPLYRLLDRARAVHRERFVEERIQASSLLSIKTGGCPENCS